MKKFGQLSSKLLLISVFLVAPNVYAEDGGNSAVAEFQDGKVEAPRGLSPSEKAGPLLRKLARKKGFKTGRWDNQKNRIMIVKQAGETIEPYDPDFLVKREALAIEASLLAKAAIIESFTTTASAENILSVPGNPIAKQLEAEQKQLKAMQAEAEKLVMLAQQETTALVAAYDEARAEELSGVTVGDRLNALLEATVKKLDESFDSQQISEEKKERLSDIKLRLEKARKIEDEKQKLEQEVENKIAELQGQIKKESRSSIETTSSMPLFGATTLMQVESYDDLRNQYNVASLVIWSPKLEQEARGILMAGGKGVPRKNKLSIDEWLDKQNLSSMVGARRYLADDGSTNFMGISAVEYDPDDSGSYSMLEEEAILWAKQAAILSLKASVESVKAAERLKRDVRGADGNIESKILKSFSANIKESVKDLTIRGLEVLRIEETIHQPTGKNIIVAVANVNSALAIKSKEIMKDLYATLKEVNANQSYVKGEEAGMKAEAAKTLNSATHYRAGEAAGESAVASEYDARASERTAMGNNQPSSNKKASTAQNTPSESGGESESGSWAGDYEVDDDF